MGTEPDLVFKPPTKTTAQFIRVGLCHPPSLPGQLVSVTLGGPWERLILLSDEPCQWLFCLHLPQKAKGQEEAEQDLFPWQ